MFYFSFAKRVLIRIDTNARLRAIDLTTHICAPILTGAIMAFTSRWVSAVVIASWNVVSLGCELILYTKVYRLAEDKLAHKASADNGNELKEILF